MVEFMQRRVRRFRPPAQGPKSRPFPRSPIWAVLLVGTLLVPCGCSGWTTDSALHHHLDPVGFTRRSALAYGPQPYQLADTYVPDGAGGEPVVIWLHGGGWVSGNRSQVSPEFISDILGSGEALVSIDWGLTQIGGSVSMYTPDLGDIADAMRWVEAEAPTMGWDPTRVVLAGFSAGATLAVDAVADDDVTRNPLAADQALRGRVIGVIAFSGIYALWDLASSSPALYASVYSFLGCPIGGTCPFDEASALSGMIDGREPPTLLIHGLADLAVPARYSQLLKAELQRAGVPVTDHYVQYVGHEQVEREYEGAWVTDFLAGLSRAPGSG